MRLGARRRCTVAAVSLGVSWMLFHGYVAALLWTRGDGFMRSGAPAVAETYYRRALAIDEDSHDALDRLFLVAIEQKKQVGLNAAILAGDRYLARHPNAVEIRMDRALAMFVARRNESAAREFSWLANRLRDERFGKFASLSRRRASTGNRT